ncbi:MAG: hypothetical protein ABI824_11900 [Acidobacteriota bacterium]
MATLAGVFGKFFTKIVESEAPFASREAAVNRLRAFPNDDIHFYIKRIDNSRVVREADPASRGTCWKTFASVVTVAILAIVVLMPRAYGLLAGRQLESLRAEEKRLTSEQAALAVEEASIATPANMLRMAKAQSFEVPAPDKVVYLPGSHRDAEFAATGTQQAGQ